MKLYRNAIILLVVLGLLVGAFFIVKNKKGTDDASQNTEVIKVLEFDREKVKELSIKNKNEELTFVKKDKDNWSLSQDASFKFSKDMITGITANIAALDAQKVVEEEAADLAKYGLATPTSVVSAKLEDGSVKTIEIGNETPTKEGYYVKVKDTKKVYSIENYIGKMFVSEREELRERSIYTVNPEEIIGFSLERKGGLVFKVKKAQDKNWEVTEPVESKADTQYLEPIFGKVASLQVTSFVEDKAADLAKYGLQNPSYSFEVETSSMKTKLLLGDKKDAESGVYAKLADSDQVFTIDDSQYDFLDRELNDIMELFVYIPSIGDVSKMVVEMDGQTTTSELQTDKEDKEKDKFFVNGKDVTALRDEGDNSLFRKYYQGLIGVMVSKVEVGANPTGKPEITITYSLKKAPGTVKIELIPKDDKTYYAMKNGKYTNMLVDKNKLNEIDGARYGWMKLQEAMNKAK